MNGNELAERRTGPEQAQAVDRSSRADAEHLPHAPALQLGPEFVEGLLGAAADHPVALAFPEGDYLKGLLVRKGG